ncbi:UDP-N-acetylmuramoyl-L-alanine--D-glutamate ligase, partial [Candidatus Dojkabacteria bacterium CG_4_10_14_3_um_filter_Dojkabacteria_WS6_41_9]
IPKMATAMEHSDVPIHKYFGLFKDAVAKAYSLAVPGDLLILCPGATSFNMFANEFDRGRQFNELVNAL